MPKESIFSKIINFIFAKLFKINDSAQKIALGVGLGVFSGLIPGTGPAAALFLAFVFRANRAAALLGSILTNTWLSIITFIIAIKVGSLVFGRHWQEVYQKVQALIHNFHWGNFFKLSFLDVVLPVVIGYLIIGLFLGLISYLVVLLITRKMLQRN
ncbi:MAG: DUF2062 domain-containing protein [Candidatus Omnitrophica bacterium]|jgi:uncharacterized protein (DUF2062 family)|nr:DUF2062 domain-containing protein [Candidatus Omnitrophota bacterium]MDD5691081.1 DUF2062 domain-containing protein [Candidatus Omnitrophota bacterium]